ncbi:PREDICTED: leucine-rich PPR motif-containing protein, mitochondrial-like isoform X2 [Polistes canadensis]|uniref:leucine-rich PPR motif-containing protein, mitochondrial-like isoform X2 n=1 Tax=Polistes canadensis TaxID=91411 RepID=UPI000718F6CE|nr:PREDICTED: leucine-rich PPR motif-containing protein, mitochondrial-like isoform X2 [Polistes canadensis]
MALFFHSIKCIRNLRNISKLIQIGGSNKRFLCLANVSNVLEMKVSMPTDFYGYQTSEQGIDSLIEKVNKNLQNRKLIDKNMIDEIIQYVQIEGKIDSSQALPVLRSCNLLIQCTPEQRIDLATTLWKLFGIYNVQMDVSYYNALLKIYLKNKHEFSPLDILSDMKKQSIEPNENTYKELLKYYCMKGNMSGAMTVFQCMKDEKHVLTEDVFNSFILGYTQARDLTSAVNVLQIMEKVNLTPTNKTYSALMCAYATYNDTESIEEVLFKCRMKNIKFTNEDLLDVIYTLIANKNVDYVNEMLVKLKRPFHMEALEFLAKIIDLKQENIAMKIFYYFYSDIKFKLMKIQYENFFIHKLIYSGAPIEKIVETCKQFYTCYGNKKIFYQAIYYAFKQNEDALVSSLLKEWKSKGHKLRPHYFWPFLTKLQENHDIKGLLEYVKDMKEVYGVVPCINTVADYILPNLLTPSMSTAFFLSEYNIPIETTRNAVVYYWLSYFKTKLSADYVIQHPCYYDDFILKSKLKWSLFNTCDIDSYLIIANTLYRETTSGAKEKVSLDENIFDIMNFLKDNPTRISKILQYISKNEISISDNTYKILTEYQMAGSINKTTVLLENLREVNNSSQLLTWNIATSKQINVSIINKLFNEYSREESKKILQTLIIKNPTCIMAKLALNYAKKLISVGDLNDAAELIKYTGQIIKVNSPLLAKETKKLLNEVALIGNDTVLHRFVDILLQQNYVTPSTNYLNLLITIHVDQGNVRKALEIAEMLNNKYNHIPALKTLIKLIVLAKDTEILQDFINIAIKTYEEEYILGELILCFLRKNFEEEAKKLIQLFCTSNYNLAVIENISRYYSTKCRSMMLEKLLDFTVGYPNVNRLILYECLAFIYVSRNDHLSGIELWNRMRKEKILPTPKLKNILPVHY